MRTQTNTWSRQQTAPSLATDPSCCTPPCCPEGCCCGDESCADCGSNCC